MAATTKAALLQITRKELDKLDALMAQILPARAIGKDADDTSIKDVIAHRAHWIDLFLGRYADGQAGKPVYFPAEGYKWNDLKRYNADLRARQADMDWDAAQHAFHGRAAALLAFVEGCSEDALYGGPMKGANNARAPGRWAEAAGPSHFRSAAKYIRARLKSGL